MTAYPPGRIEVLVRPVDERGRNPNIWLYTMDGTRCIGKVHRLDEYTALPPDPAAMAIAQRIVACWNAFVGVPDTACFSGPGGPHKEPLRVRLTGGVLEIANPRCNTVGSGMMAKELESLSGLGISAEAEMALGVEGLRGSDVLCRELASRVVMEAETREGGAGISRDGAVEVVMEVLRRLGVVRGAVQQPFVPFPDPNIEFEEPTVPVDLKPEVRDTGTVDVCARCRSRKSARGLSWCRACLDSYAMNTDATPLRSQDAGGSCGRGRGTDAAPRPDGGGS